MNIQKLPLTERLQRIEDGYPAHLEYNASAIQTMAHTPISVYLHDYELARARLMEILKPWGATDNMSYQEIAAFIRDLQHTPQVGAAIAAEVADHLAAPLLHCFSEREADYGAIDKGSAE